MPGIIGNVCRLAAEFRELFGDKRLRVANRDPLGLLLVRQACILCNVGRVALTEFPLWVNDFTASIEVVY